MYQALPIVVRAMVGILPFFIGFTFLGLCLFWEVRQFSSPGEAMFTLFSVMNGDQISDVYAQVTFSHLMIGSIYMYSFVFISIWYVFLKLSNLSVFLVWFKMCSLQLLLMVT
jgi:hypothetical protein